ncbi:YeiH family protein [Mycolicibacterium sp. Dal123E01]|uniref:YeiH family protein n=1 Tax=Mycolicibacterium sp. Dal123E01 TaxID=3457578 RepID=UPI00403E9380
MTTTDIAQNTEEQPIFTSRNLLDYVPGVLLLIGIGLLGKYAQIWWNALAKKEHWTVPDIEYVLWAIVIGLLITNTVGVHRIFRPGVQTYEFWLKIGIVALGARFVLGDIVKLGGISLVQILLDMAIAGTVILLAAKAFGLSGKLGSLLAIGTSICGVSAIVASKGAIRARNSDVSYAIAAILALGAVALFTLPVIGHGLGLSDHEFGLWAGLAVDNTAETTATGYLYSDEAGKLAVLVKSVRNALIGFVVLGFALYWASKGQADEIAAGFSGKAKFVWEKFPKFVLGFLAVSALATAHLLSKGQVANLGNVSKWAFLLTFAGVGLNTNFRELARTGWRPLVVAVIGLVVVAVVSLGLVLVTSRVLHWGVGAT